MNEFATGMLAPGRSVWANTSIAMGATLFSDGANGAALTGAGAEALFGGSFGPFSGEVNDIFGSFGGEFISNEVKDAGKKKQ